MQHEEVVGLLTGLFITKSLTQLALSQHTLCEAASKCLLQSMYDVQTGLASLPSDRESARIAVEATPCKNRKEEN